MVKRTGGSLPPRATALLSTSSTAQLLLSMCIRPTAELGRPAVLCWAALWSSAGPPCSPLLAATAAPLSPAPPERSPPGVSSHLASLVSHLVSLVSNLVFLVSHLVSLVSHHVSLVSNQVSLVSHMVSLVSNQVSQVSHLVSLVSLCFSLPPGVSGLAVLQ